METTGAPTSAMEATETPPLYYGVYQVLYMQTVIHYRTMLYSGVPILHNGASISYIAAQVAIKYMLVSTTTEPFSWWQGCEFTVENGVDEDKDENEHEDENEEIDGQILASVELAKAGVP